MRIERMRLPGQWTTRLWYLLVPVVVVGVVAAWRLAGRSTARPAAMGLTAVPVGRGTVEVMVTGTGTLEAGQRANITAEVAGTVVAVHFEEGDVVRKGQPLIELRNDELAAQVEQARLSLAAAQNRLYQRLGLPQGSPVDLAEALVVRAPVGGRISRLAVKAGDRVGAGQAVAWVVPGEEVLFRARVNRIALPWLQPGQRARVHLDAFDGELPGTVARVSSAPSRSGGVETFDMDVRLEQAGVLAAGYTGQVTVETPAGNLTFSGQTAWREEQVVTARADGVVGDLPVSEGQVVTEGQVLVRLQNPSLGPSIEADQIAVEQARQTLAQREQSLGKLRIVAPIDGVITSRNVSVGDTIGDGQDRGKVLATILDTRSLNLTLQVDELDLPRLRPGQTAVITVAALPGRQFQGTVQKIAAEGTVQNGVSTFPVTLSVPGGPDLRPGMTASATISVARRDRVLVIPAEAVQRDGARAWVEVLEGDRPVRRAIRTGLENAQVVEVVDGLAEGERVVVARAAPTAGRASGPGTGAGFRGPGFGPGAFRGAGGPEREARPAGSAGAGAGAPVRGGGGGGNGR